MKNWYRQSFTLVNPEQLAAMKYRGCATPRAVLNFCTRHNVPRIWWKPQDSPKRVLMVDLYNFWNCWYEIYGQTQYNPQLRQWRQQMPMKQSPRSTRQPHALKAKPRMHRKIQRSTQTKPRYRKAA